MATEAARHARTSWPEFGPLRGLPVAGQRLDTAAEPDRLVKTHCCFCGQQCGIQLKVKDNQVIGFEPWVDFPFNKGMLCPKGVRRYLQGSHHDRLTSAYVRDPSSPEGFRAVPYDEAIRRVAAEIRRIQSTYGNDAFAVLGGASMTTEKCYLLGKFARVCLKTRLHRLQRPALHGRGRGRQQEGVRHRPGRQPDVGHPARPRSIWIGGANVAECAPITTSYIWQARENGARIIVVDPRITPLARTCGPVPPGQARPGRRAVRRRPPPDDRERLARPRLHRRPHRRLRGGGRGGERVDAAEDGRGDRDRREGDPPGGRVVGDGEDQLPDARPGHGAARPRRENCLGVDQHRARVAGGSAGRAAATRRSPARATARAAASTARSADQLPGGRDIENPEHRRHVAGVWGIARGRAAARRGRLLRDLPQGRVAARSGACSPGRSTRSSPCRTARSSSGCWRSWSSSPASTSS